MKKIFLTYAIASKIAINTISMTSITENVLNIFFISPPFFYLFFSRSTINCSGSAPTYALPTTAGLSPRRRLLPPLWQPVRTYKSNLHLHNYHYAITNIYPYNNHKKKNTPITTVILNFCTANYLSIYYTITTFYSSYPQK